MIATVAVSEEPFEAVAPAWAELLRDVPAPVPFVTPEWQRVWLRHFQGDREARVLTAREGDRLVAVAPFLFSGDRAEFVGHYSICDYMDIVVRPGSEAQVYPALFEKLADCGAREIELRGLRESSPTLPAVEQAAAALGARITREEEALSPAVDLPGDWEQYLGGLSKKDRHELRRKMRRLESAGGTVELNVLTGADESDAMLDTLFHLMRISNHHKEEFLERPGMEAFFRDAARTMAGAGMLRFYFLTFDGQAVASVLNFDLGGRLYMYNSGYDPAYAHYAVGLMSKTLLIRDAIEHGRTCVDFMRGDESYKYDLGGKDQRVFRAVLTR
ncbi:MAG: GNAT family N-acetyltransferase [Chloroflexi bacterium]|nr:GNAT family N-acetyltransferase [Chloroflexota bacterium]